MFSLIRGDHAVVTQPAGDLWLSIKPSPRHHFKHLRATSWTSRSTMALGDTVATHALLGVALSEFKLRVSGAER